ncbi:MAG: phosphate acyltransferase [Candidatus Micrarchaeota archaeon]|nr:phosphate acyltransferase [Candidatus Micrarchaeota archaeon]
MYKNSLFPIVYMAVISMFGKSSWKQCRILLPEPEDERILLASRMAKDRGFAVPILVGNKKSIEKSAKSLKIDLSDIEIIDTSKGIGKRYADEYSKIRKVPKQLAERMLENPLFLSALILRIEEADAMIAGAVFTSADVITASEGIIGLRKGVSVPSSFFIMEIPGYQGGEKSGNNGLLLFADSSVNIDPTAEQLADVAITTANTAKELMGWIPRVALLSFSTKGSAIHPKADKIINATKIANKKAPNLFIDGELQGDSALVEKTAIKKMKGKIGNVAGRANVLIFPDLDSGNISYKLVQTLAGANAYGPILQGFNKPVSDLSRGAKPEDIVGTIAILSTWAKRMKR